MLCQEPPSKPTKISIMKNQVAGMTLPSPSSQPAYPHQQGPLIPSSVFSSDRELQELVNRRDMRISSTHDLAEFLRSSRPEDYSRPQKDVDDHILDGGHRKMSFKFLKSASKDLLSPRKSTVPLPVPSTLALPEKVRPKKTSKGNSYLAIQVEYTPGRDSPETFLPSLWMPNINGDGSGDCVRKPISADFSSDRSNYRNSFVSQSWKDQDMYQLSSNDEFATNNRKTISSWMRNSSESDLSSSRTALIISPSITPQSSVPYSICIPKERSRPAVSPISSPLENSTNHYNAKVSVLPKSNTNPSTLQRRYSSDSTLRTRGISTRSVCFSSSSPARKDDTCLPVPPLKARPDMHIKPNEAYTNPSINPAQPGPPPSRCLPSLPEGHGDAINLASKIRAAAATRSSIGSQISLASETGSLKHRRIGTPCRTRSEREISVKARKIKDLEDSRTKRGLMQGDLPHSYDSASSRSKRNQGQSRKQKRGATDTLSMSPITVVYEVAPESHSKAKLISEISRCRPSVASSEALVLLERSAEPRSDKKISEKATWNNSIAREPPPSKDTIIARLESRLESMEKRYKCLEQVLLAIVANKIPAPTECDTEGPVVSELLQSLTNHPISKAFATS